MTRRATSPVFVARREELDLLRESFDQAVEGVPSIVLVAGEAGVGKSRLASEFAETARSRGARVLAGGCLDVSDGGLPYAPLSEALRRLASDVDDETRALIAEHLTPELARLAPGLAARAIPVESGGIDPELRRARLFDAAIALLAALASRSPVVFIVEDLHWADASTRDLVRFLVHNLAAERLLIIATYRTEGLHRRHSLAPLLAELERSDRVEHVQLEPFDADDLADQIHAILGQPPTPAMVESMLERSDGLPFYVEELLAGSTTDGAAIPETLRAILELRLAALPTATLEVVRAASVAGNEFSHARVAAIVELDETLLIRSLRDAIEAEILVPVLDGSVPRYRFRHALLRESAYEQLLPLERVRLHARLAAQLAELIKSTEAADPGVVELFADMAVHAYHAHDLTRALDGSVRAMTHLAGIPALHEAHAHGERALELWPQVPGAEELAGMSHPELLLTVARIGANLGRAGEAATVAGEAVREMEALAEQPLEPAARGRRSTQLVTALDELARYAWEATDFDTGAAAIRLAHESLDDEVPPTVRASIFGMLGFVSWSEGRLSEAERFHRQAMDLAASIGDRRGWALAASMLSEALAFNGQPVRAGELADDAAAVLDTMLAPRSLAAWDFYAAAGRESALCAVGRYEDSAAIAREGMTWAERYGLERHGAYSRMSLMESLVELGRYDEVRFLARPFVARSVATAAVMWILQHVAAVAIAQGRFDEARHYIELGRAIPAIKINEAYRLAVVIDLARAERRFADVQAAMEQAIVGSTAQGTLGSTIGGLELAIAAAHREIEEARLRRREAEAKLIVRSAERWLGILRGLVRAARDAGGAGPLWEAILAMAAAHWSVIEGRRDSECWQQAVDRWDALPRPLWAAMARLGLAEALLATGGDRDRAATELRLAYDAAAAMDAEPLRAQVEDVARRARIELGAERAPGEPPAPAVALTARERATLRLVRAGHTNREIASQLFISEKTASVHVSNAMAKLGALSRYEAAATAERLGLLD